MDVSSVVFNLNSDKPDDLRKFYSDLVRLKPNPDMGEGALIAATTPFIVDSHDLISGPTKEPARTMTNFMVDDVVKEQERLEAAGVRFLGPPSADVISFATFVDPDGSYGQIFSMPGTPPGTEGFAAMRHSEDPERLKDFLRNVVGLSDEHPELGNPFIAGETSIYIGAHSDVVGPSKEPARAMLNFFVADVAAEQKRIEGHGVRFIRSSGREAWGGIISTFADPDGNYLQLIEFRP